MPAPAKSKTAKTAKVSLEKSTVTSPTARPVKKGDHVFLVDGSGYIFRAYHAIRFEPRAPDGTHVNAVYGSTCCGSCSRK
jgi:DNA polymerase-1